MKSSGRVGEAGMYGCGCWAIDGAPGKVPGWLKYTECVLRVVLLEWINLRVLKYNAVLQAKLSLPACSKGRGCSFQVWLHSIGIVMRFMSILVVFTVPSFCMVGKLQDLVCDPFWCQKMSILSCQSFQQAALFASTSPLLPTLSLTLSTRNFIPTL